ncbi:hypothetical protein LXL04_033194 [Taraxacum kok-saghyz]
MAFIIQRRLSKNKKPNVPIEEDALIRKLEREKLLHRLLHGGKCRELIRVSEQAFKKLCTILQRDGGLRPTQRMSVEEHVARFLHIVGNDMRNTLISWTYRRSKSTTSRCFHRVLRAVIALESRYIQQPQGNVVAKEIQEKNRFYPYFKNCVGAIDGTHVRVKVHSKDAPRYRGRKGYPTINVLAACSFDLKFTYVLTGWEGTASDSRILKSALNREDKLVIPPGRYCLVDAGLPHTTQLMTPYRGVRYHLKEYSARPPKNARELFNLRHASLRNAIERAFGVLKRRFPIVRSTQEPFYSCETQSDIFLACCILHNFLIDEDRDIRLEREVLQELLHEQSEEVQRNRSIMSKQTTAKKEHTTWIEKMNSTFIEAMIEQQEAGNRINGTFTSQAYSNMVLEMSTKLNMNFTKDQLKNRMKSLKINFSKWYDMFNGTALSGFSWNSETQLIEAEEEVWADLIIFLPLSLLPSNSETQKIKKKPFLYFPSLSFLSLFSFPSLYFLAVSTAAMAASLSHIPSFFSPATTTNSSSNRIRTLFYFKPTPTQSHKSFAILCSSRPDYIPNHISEPNYVRIFDTTLRDGEQSPGATMTSKEKLDIARQLAKLGVDIIEAGFPASSEADLEAVKLIAQEVGNVGADGHVPVICGLARCNKNDIDKSWEAVKHAKFPRIHTFIATSEIHMQYKLKMSKEQVIEKARSMVAYARSLGCNDVEFSPEDAGRSEREFLYEILGEVIKAGATTLNIPDTVGYNWPREFGQLIADIKANTPGIENVIISTHCQNDLGLSTANTLEGAYNGARQLEVTINGIGERAGNASLEEVVMTIKCKGELLGGLHTGINTRHIVMASKMVEEYSGLMVQPHKAIVGANAFAHESGIHQDGMLKNRNTYEIMSPEDIGLHRSNESGLTLGKLSGRHALKSKLFELGYDIDGKELNDLFWRFKSVAEMKKVITDDDLVALVSDEVFQPQVVWKFGDVQVTCGTLGLSTATVKLIDNEGKEYIACSTGTGPVDAAYKAVDIIVKAPVKLLEYSMSAVTAGIDAIASTRVVINAPDCNHTTTHSSGDQVMRSYSGTGASMDIVISSVRAYVSALNKMLGMKIQASK